MAGKIKEMIDIIIANQSRKNLSLVEITKTKLVLKGINPDKYNEYSEDDEKIIKKIRKFADELHINLDKDNPSIVTSYSTNLLEEEAVKEIKAQCKDHKYKLIVFFASIFYDQQKICSLMHEAFPEAITLGASSYGEFHNGTLYNQALVAMAIDEEALLDVRAEVIEDLKEDNCVEKAFAGFEKQFNQPMKDLDFQRYTGMLIMDGMSCLQEKIMADIGSLTNIMFIGGASSDNWEMNKTYQYLNGKVYSDGAILTVLKPKVDFKILKTQSFYPLSESFTATKVDEKARKVYEFNGRPASEFYSEAIRKPIEGIEEYFKSHSIGVMIGNDPYIHNPRILNKEDGSMYFYSSIPEGVELKVLKSGDVVEDTKKDFEREIQALGGSSGVINFNCASRTERLKKENCAKEHGEIFKNIPMVGFSTYGEYYIGLINQTATMLIFR